MSIMILNIKSIISFLSYHLLSKKLVYLIHETNKALIFDRKSAETEKQVNIKESIKLIKH